MSNRIIKIFWRMMLFLVLSLPFTASAQIIVRDSVLITDSLPRIIYEQYWARIPLGYDPLVPPPLFIACHALGADFNDAAAQSILNDTASAWGWIVLAINGEPANERGWAHWWSQRALHQLDLVMDTLAHNYPFDPDRIYFVGGSMGGAAGMQYNNSHMDPNGYMCAATASGSGIIDLIRRAREQGSNVSMSLEFGGRYDSTSAINFRYKRNSAIVSWDTSNSLHYNLKWLPTYLAAGVNEAHFTHASDLVRMFGPEMRSVWLQSGVGANHGWINIDSNSTMTWIRQQPPLLRHPTVQSVAADCPRRCYDLRFEELRCDTNMARAIVQYDSLLFDNHWYLTHPILNSIRNASRLRLYRDIIPSRPDTIEIFNRDTASFALAIEYGRPPIADNSFQVIPPLPFSIELQNNVVVVILPDVPQGYHGMGTFRYLNVKEGYSMLPSEYNMSVYPNPFNGMTTVRLNTPNGGLMSLKVYDVTGRVVKSIPNKFLRSSGSVSFSLPAGELSSGNYFIRGNVGSKVVQTRMTLIK